MQRNLQRTVQKKCRKDSGNKRIRYEDKIEWQKQKNKGTSLTSFSNMFADNMLSARVVAVVPALNGPTPFRRSLAVDANGACGVASHSSRLWLRSAATSERKSPKKEKSERRIEEKTKQRWFKLKVNFCQFGCRCSVGVWGAINCDSF